MRVMIFAAALFAAACGPSTEQSSTSNEVDAGSSDDLDRPAGIMVGYGREMEFNVVIDPTSNEIFLQTSQDVLARVPYVEPQQISDRQYQFRSGNLTVDLSSQPCSLGEGSGVFSYQASVTLVGRPPMSGCAIERWDTNLTDLLPAIDACLEASPLTRQISFAEEKVGSTLVRMRGGDEEIDCWSAGERGQVSARNRSHIEAGEFLALFVRAPGENPGGECYDAPEVRNADGEVLGWMMDPLGC